MKLQRAVLNVLQIVAVLGPIAGGGIAQVEGTTNTQDIILIVAGLVLGAVAVVTNRQGTTPIEDPKVPAGTQVTYYENTGY